jgi:ribosome-binding factor A
MDDRMERVNALLRRELGRILEEVLELPEGCFVTVVRVKTARDLRSAVVWVSVLPIDRREHVLALLVEHQGGIQRELGTQLTAMRYVPKLHYRIDEREERADQINRLIDSVASGGKD